MVKQEIDYKKKASNLLKAELKRRGITYKQLVEKLKEVGIEENEHNITTKLHRGTFSFVFLLQCMDAIGCEKIDII